MLALLLAATTPQTAIDAERAFAADAQKIGQWTAFRKWATADAIMFLPRPARVQEATKNWPGPKQAIRWSPAVSYVSRDGVAAVNTGPWRRPDGSVGFFSTVWVKQPDGSWRWIVDGGDALTRARWPLTVKAEVRRAGRPPKGGLIPPPPAAIIPRPGYDWGEGASPDQTLRWRWVVDPSGARTFAAELWNDRTYTTVINDKIAAPTR